MGLDHLSLLAHDLQRFSAAVEHGPADAPIAGCPGWTLRDLGVHLGDVHRWVLGALATGGPPPAHDDPAPADDLAALADWVRDGGARLLAALAAADPSAPTWHPFPVEPKVAGLWPRRQAQEASVHRWDAERAIGLVPTIEPAFAADGVDEYWTVMLPRMLVREVRVTPPTTIVVTTVDTGDRWVIDGSTGRPTLRDTAEWADDDAVVGELRGEATSVLLALWGRPADGIEVAGDADAVAAWLALGGA